MQIQEFSEPSQSQNGEFSIDYVQTSPDSEYAEQNESITYFDQSQPYDHNVVTSYDSNNALLPSSGNLVL